jgi:hypothetical protein
MEETWEVLKTSSTKCLETSPTQEKAEVPEEILSPAK